MATGLIYEGGIMTQQTPEAVSAEERMKQLINVLTSSSKQFLIGHYIQNFDVPIFFKFQNDTDFKIQKYDNQSDRIFECKLMNASSCVKLMYIIVHNF